MRLAYLGSPEVAVGPLRALVDAGHQVELVVTQPDRRRARGAVLPTPVKAAAADLGLPVTERVADVVDVGVDLGVVVAFGRIIRPEVLDRVPMINLHFSLLPRWRGAAPVERAILAGDSETGVCIMAVEAGLDTGAVYAREAVAIGADTTAGELRSELAARGTARLLDLLASPFPDPEPQQGEPTWAAKLTAKDRRLDWNLPAQQLHRVVRLGGAWTRIGDRRLGVVQAGVVDDYDPAAAGSIGDPGQLDPSRLVVQTGRGGLVLEVVQPEGRSAMAASDWRNGARPQPGTRLG
ncbi:MAG: methionyl-tRNA formyltransferase [Acidimicrobiales bacterium]